MLKIRVVWNSGLGGLDVAREDSMVNGYRVERGVRKSWWDT